LVDLTTHILYEDDDILAINKPAGLVVHSDARTDEPSVAEWMAEKYPESKNVGEPLELKDGRVIARPGIVHRIDRETSGLLLLAKTESGFGKLKKQFQDRTIDKVYRLFVHGIVKEDHGSIRLPIGRSTSDFRKWSAERGARGDKREALTYFKVLKRNQDPEVTFVEAKPKTGRTHQIRVHFKALHHPVVADSLYVPKKSTLLGFSRLALHAYSATFKNLVGKEVTVIAPYPEDFKRAIASIGYNVLD
jgi:23S rRNA pseudouridine1911/1915/1917 synthase